MPPSNLRRKETSMNRYWTTATYAFKTICLFVVPVFLLAIILLFEGPVSGSGPVVASSVSLRAPMRQGGPTVTVPGSGSRTYPETGKTVRGLFLDYWDKHGGLAQQGFPISEVLGE